MERLRRDEEALLSGLGAGPQGKRESLSQRAGDAILSGDKAMAKVLEEALRQRGRIERVTHGFHTYPAGLHPDAAAQLLTLGAGPVLDPFCGGGTVLVESLLAGRSALGLDVSPIAAMVARARTAITTEEERTALRSAARRATELAMSPPPPMGLPPDIEDWYEPHVLAELGALRDAIGKDPLLRAVFSAILVKVSRRRSDTSAGTKAEPRHAGTTATLFHKKAREFARMLEELAAQTPPGVVARVHREDAREFRGKGEYGQVVTSPPYPGVYDYLPMQRLRLDWLEMDPGGAWREEIGSRRSFRADRATGVQQWREDCRRWIKAMSKALGTGGRMIVVVGDGNVGGKRIDSLTPLEDAARDAGLVRPSRCTVERWDEGVNAMRPEHAVLFEKPAAQPEAREGSHQ